MNYPDTKTVWRILLEDPYRDRSEEFMARTVEGAAALVDDLTGVDADIVISDVESGTLPWEWFDPEDGREVTLRKEVGIDAAEGEGRR